MTKYKELWFEYVFGELFEAPIQTNLVELRPDIDIKQFHTELLQLLSYYWKEPDNA